MLTLFAALGTAAILWLIWDLMGDDDSETDECYEV